MSLLSELHILAQVSAKLTYVKAKNVLYFFVSDTYLTVPELQDDNLKDRIIALADLWVSLYPVVFFRLNCKCNGSM